MGQPKALPWLQLYHGTMALYPHPMPQQLIAVTCAAAGARASELQERASSLLAAAERSSSCAPFAAERPPSCRQAKEKKGKKVCGGGGAGQEPCGAQGAGAERWAAALGRVVWAREKGWNAWPALVVSAGDAAAAAPQLSRADSQSLKFP